jgi:hypothetical protein
VQSIDQNLPSVPRVAWILVVEKEAVFQTLHEALIRGKRNCESGMIVTVGLLSHTAWLMLTIAGQRIPRSGYQTLPTVRA